jgi:5'(3')-deoxyribonucleotidase
MTELKPIIYVDVDLTLVDVDKHWIKYLEDTYGFNYTLDCSIVENIPLPYNLCELWGTTIPKEKYHDFWRNPKLYDNLKPLPFCQTALYLLSKKYDIIFWSHCFEEHIDSKNKFLETYFPFGQCLIADKSVFVEHIPYIKYVIDDRLDKLELFDFLPITKKLLYPSNYLQYNTGIDLTNVVKLIEQGYYTEVTNWQDILTLITITGE